MTDRPKRWTKRGDETPEGWGFGRSEGDPPGRRGRGGGGGGAQGRRALPRVALPPPPRVAGLVGGAVLVWTVSGARTGPWALPFDRPPAAGRTSPTPISPAAAVSSPPSSLGGGASPVCLPRTRAAPDPRSQNFHRVPTEGLGSSRRAGGARETWVRTPKGTGPSADGPF